MCKTRKCLHRELPITLRPGVQCRICHGKSEPANTRRSSRIHIHRSIRSVPWLPTARSAARPRSSGRASLTRTGAPTEPGSPTSSVYAPWSALAARPPNASTYAPHASKLAKLPADFSSTPKRPPPHTRVMAFFRHSHELSSEMIPRHNIRTLTINSDAATLQRRNR